jgi:hypothetical protein
MLMCVAGEAGDDGVSVARSRMSRVSAAPSSMYGRGGQKLHGRSHPGDDVDAFLQQSIAQSNSQWRRRHRVVSGRIAHKLQKLVERDPATQPPHPQPPAHAPLRYIPAGACGLRSARLSV